MRVRVMHRDFWDGAKLWPVGAEIADFELRKGQRLSANLAEVSAPEPGLRNRTAEFEAKEQAERQREADEAMSAVAISKTGAQLMERTNARQEVERAEAREQALAKARQMVASQDAADEAGVKQRRDKAKQADEAAEAADRVTRSRVESEASQRRLEEAAKEKVKDDAKVKDKERAEREQAIRDEQEAEERAKGHKR